MCGWVDGCCGWCGWWVWVWVVCVLCACVRARARSLVSVYVCVCACEHTKEREREKRERASERERERARMTSMCTHTQCKRDLLQCKRDLLAHDQQVYTHTVKICGNKACETSSSSTCLLFGISTSSISHMYLKKKMLFEILSSSSRLMYATRTCATPPTHTHSRTHRRIHRRTQAFTHTQQVLKMHTHTHTHTHTNRF